MSEEQKYVNYFTDKLWDEFSGLIHRHLHGYGGPQFTPAELLRYDELLTLQARQDFVNWGAVLYPGHTEQEMIPHLKAKYERDCLGG